MSTQEDYDKLSKEDREKYDSEQREKERVEQAALPYQWRQELGELAITVPVPKGTRGKSLNVVLAKKKLLVGVKGSDPIMDGELCHEIKVDDSTWTLEDQQFVIIHLEKLNQQQWWQNVLTHHPKIDTTKIQPENSKLSDLDGETRGMVEKMMFDNQQKVSSFISELRSLTNAIQLEQQMGKPTSDELKKHEALKKFQDAHPEMDFSQAKIS